MTFWKIVISATVVTGCGAELDGPNDANGANGGSAGASGATNGGATSGSSGASGAAGSASGAAGTGATTTDPNCDPGVPATSQIPRLTNADYDRTVRDLVGVTELTAQGGSVPSNLLATDQAGGLTDVGWAAYKRVGEDIAAQVMADPALRTRFIACDPAAPTCLHDTVIAFGRKAFRRPLSTEEIATFDAVIALGSMITPTGAPAEVAEALLYMFLISPSFIQREELDERPDGTGRFLLSSHEVASRLSYTLWGSMPDDELRAAADARALETPEQILSQAERMILDPKARDMVQAFHRYYALMGANTRWDNTNKDTTLYPAFDRNLVPLMQKETEMFFDRVVFGMNGRFEDLLTSRVAFVSSATAPLYGLDPAGFSTNLTETTLAENRLGFLTRLGFLNAYSAYEGNSPILRGAFITKQVLGIPLGAPPPGAEQTPLPPISAELNTNRKRYDALTAGDACSGCHIPFVNPPGFALESFNTVGSWQTTEHDTGQPIDTAAEIMLDDVGPPVHVAGPAELMTAIAGSPGAKAQYAAKWVSYAYQREGHPDDACDVRKLAAKMTNGGYTVQNLITDLTQTRSFRVRAAEP
jgi:hypothetical protein